MAETLAASIIKYSGWNGKKPLYDPFCGSGTLLCEAYLHLSNTPSAFMRKKFGFERLPDFEPALWKEVKERGMKGIKTVPKGIITGSDIQRDVVETAQKNCLTIDRNRTVKITQKDAFSIANLENHTIICNPPYGLRLSKNSDLSSFYKNIGDFLKQRCQGSDAYIYFGERKYIKNIGLRASWKKPLKNAKLDGRLVKYELY